MEFLPHTPEDRAAMLRAIGVSSVEELFSDIPEAVRRRFRPPGLEPLTELEVHRLLSELSRQNADPDQFVSFLGGGVYDHYVPSVVGHLLLRQEFYTCYTPYQAELSQGTLAWMFEFQTMICELTGMEVANSSLYDGASALAEAALMAHRVTGRRRFAVARSLNPLYRRVLETYAWAEGFQFEEIGFDQVTGQLDRRALAQAAQEPLAGLLVQSPNFLGVIEDLDGLKGTLDDGLLIVGVNPLSLGLLEPPGRWGADVVTGEGQFLGSAPNFGGPLLGLFATRQEYVRRMPGRLAGRTTDTTGATGYVMTLQAREQHIRRARATSNICTNQALLALGGTIYLALLGRRGLRQLAELITQKAHYLAQKIEALEGYRVAFAGPFFNEFVIEVDRDRGRSRDPLDVRRRLRDRGVLVLDPGILRPLGLENHLLLAVTEKRTRAQLDRLVACLEAI